ncbi:MAG: cation:proton antiport protein, partial [Arsenophonus endosymbiont of Dermacentor nuttalli]
IIVRAHYDDEVRYIRERGANHIVVGEHQIAKTMVHFLAKKKTTACAINNNDDSLLSGTKDLDKYLKPDVSN